MSEKYNGWANYETWNASLWMDYDDEYWQERIDELKDEHTDEEEDIDRRAVVGNLADELKSQIDERAPDLGSGMFADILGAGLSAIDWHEIADHMVD